MATTRIALTDGDIRTLVRGATADERALAAHRICRTIEERELTDEERQLAHDILRVMAADAAELVRRAVAVTLQASPALPRDVALALAKDIESISLPVLNFSPAFTDDDLAEIVRVGGPMRQVAIAKRPQLSERVADAIVDQGDELAVQAVCSNDNAALSERSLQSAMERFAKSEQVLAAVAYRSVLPLSVTERLIDMVGDAVRDHILDHHRISPELALEIAVGSKERATIDLVDQAGRAADLKAFATHLRAAGRLNASLLLRALAQGHMGFFEHGVAELAGVPHHRTWLMIHDAGPLGLRAIYDRAALPSRLFPAFRAGVDAYHGMDFDGRPGDRERFQERMLQRFLTQPHTAAREDVDYLLEKLDRLGASAAEQRVAG
ncbi:MAG: hypothetical protein BGN86_10405 [Caulobacterales bacterium 68-7]|nr:DUF2336 domain-containing protein [Caulobacterales bacterium]OJU09641.1 MAG: hypothetical protein BGN86_10405 [Caulobacterales bacterium 68-7]